MNNTKIWIRSALICAISIIVVLTANAQTEVMAWGNLTGIRVEGQLMEFETSLRVVGNNWSVISATGKEKQPRPRYDRDGITQTVNTDFGGIQFSEIVKENGTGSAIVTLTAKAVKDTLLDGVYFCIELPGKYYENATVRLNGSGKKQALSGLVSTAGKIRKLSAKSIIAEYEMRQLSIKFDVSSSLIIRKEKNIQGYQLYIGLMGADVKKDQQAKKNITVKATGTIDKTPAMVVVDTQNPGMRFDGFGGNFRLQNPKADPQVIQYCLDNLRVAWEGSRCHGACGTLMKALILLRLPEPENLTSMCTNRCLWHKSLQRQVCQ